MSGAVVTIAQEASAINATQANTTADIGSLSTNTGSGLGGASPSPDALGTIGTVGAGGCAPGAPSARAPQREAILVGCHTHRRRGGGADRRRGDVAGRSRA